ncbi:hypothetical protein GOP47_0011633 [Adiantum capillus-veneris]|uniref:RING-type E3 ubiquitin transferase n=1 Tax=Adiantum capillus-veneris TaxID=13818 RepID=A0A9D4UT48_ADICA|nr:hypothetical protein GOP47_0011633 [Adiantum capillus-veneris]
MKHPEREPPTIGKAMARTLLRLKYHAPYHSKSCEKRARKLPSLASNNKRSDSHRSISTSTNGVKRLFIPFFGPLVHSISCYLVTCGSARHDEEHQLYEAIKRGDIDNVRRALELTKSVNYSVNQGYLYQKTSPLQIAAYLGNVDVLTLLLEMGAESNARNAYGQTPLMFACKGGNALCVEQLLHHSADALAFEAVSGRTCLHIACRQGHHECVVKVLEAARNGPISATWGFTSFVNVRDQNGAIPLHMAARAGHAEIVRLLLNHGALISAVTCTSTYGPGHGSTPLHCAAKSGSLSCVEELLAWGADRTRQDIMGNTPYMVAAHRGNLACATILNPSAAEPMVWPSPLKFMQELEPETRSILQAALAQANHARNASAQLSAKKRKSTVFLTSFCFGNFNKAGFYEDHSEDDVQRSTSLKLEDVGSGCFTCCICFENCHKMIEVDVCGHQMCAACTMALCCLNKPNLPSSSSAATPSCPFCRRDIARLKLAKAPSIKKVNPLPSTSDCCTSHSSGRRSKSLERALSMPSKQHSSLALYL